MAYIPASITFLAGNFWASNLIVFVFVGRDSVCWGWGWWGVWSVVGIIDMCGRVHAITEAFSYISVFMCSF